MTRSRLHPADHIHYSSGLSGTLKWMGYWATSRSENARRAMLRHWRSRLRPSLSEQSDAVKTRVSTALHRPAGMKGVHSYDSLADAVRQRQLMDARG